MWSRQRYSLEGQWLARVGLSLTEGSWGSFRRLLLYYIASQRGRSKEACRFWARNGSWMFPSCWDQALDRLLFPRSCGSEWFLSWPYLRVCENRWRSSLYGDHECFGSRTLIWCPIVIPGRILVKMALWEHWWKTGRVAGSRRWRNQHYPCIGSTHHWNQKCSSGGRCFSRKCPPRNANDSGPTRYRWFENYD